MSTDSRRAPTLALEGFRDPRTLRESTGVTIYAAVREEDLRAVVVKVYELDANEGLTVRIEHEFTRIQALGISGVVDSLGLDFGHGRVAVIVDRFSGPNLETYAGGQPLTLTNFMAIAMQLTVTLAEAHHHRLVHRDLRPSNIFVDLESQQVYLANFGLSALIECERQRIDDPWVVGRSLPYVSPEQTGRTHHAVDLRSDLYSLGCIFYELLTGRRPFDASTPLELIHAHLARRPQPPQRHRPELPTVLSDIVMKLLEKAPERRYQSARGLVYDLEQINHASAAGKALAEFPLGTNDVPTVLQLPHRLYGRDAEIEELQRVFREAGNGHPRCLVVSGPTGVGKTALVNQLAESVVSRRGYFARGCFSREQKDKSYAAVFSAFSELADQVLTQSDAALESWRERISARLGSGCAVLYEFVPKLRPILSPTPDRQGAGPFESRNQLALACVALIAEFADPQHPLVLSLDDLHWADEGSCELISAILAEPEIALLLVVTYRDHELPPGGPAAQLVELLRPSQFVTHLHLDQLSQDDVAALVADTLAWPVERIRPLAEVVGRNTNRNPLFVGQYLRHLVEIELLRATADGWTWEVEAIEAAGIPEDLSTMMSAKLALLSTDQRTLLSAAATIGTRFDIPTLTTLIGSELLNAQLLPITQEGLLMPLRGGLYGFTHARIREAAYELNNLERRAQLHRVVGEQCLERSALGDVEESIFEVVDHLDMGCGLFVTDNDIEAMAARKLAVRLLAGLDKDQRVLLAELNALAGHNALIGAAPRAAVRYFQAGLQLIGGVCDFESDAGALSETELNHELTFSLELGHCQALGLAGCSEQADARFEQLLQARLDFTRVGRAVAGRVEVRIAASDRRGAIACGMAGLTRLGVDVLREGGGPEQFPLNRLVPMLRSEKLRNIGEAAPIFDPRLEAVLEILSALIPVSHLVDTDLHIAFIAEHTEIMFEHGRHRSAPICLSYAAMYVGTAAGQRQLALEIVELARTLAGSEGPESSRQRIEPPYWVVASWVRPYAEGLTPLRDTVNIALGAGDLEVASYATDMLLTMSLSAGVHLEDLERIAASAERRLQMWEAEPLSARADAYLHFSRALLIGDEAALALDRPFPTLEHRPTQHMVRLLRAQTAYLFGHWQTAFDLLNSLEDFAVIVSAAWHRCDFALFYGLSATALAAEKDDTDEAESSERAALLFIAEMCLEQLEIAAEMSPANCTPRAALLDAEFKARSGHTVEAMTSFSAARRSAAEYRIPWLEALALERSAVLLHGLGLDELAEGPLREARARYTQWGALTKVAALDRAWPQFRETTREPSGRLRTANPLRTVSPSSALDLATILKSSQAIAGELEIADVVDRVMAIALESAGAERGALLLRDEAGLALTALYAADGSSRGFLFPGQPLGAAASEVPVSVIRWVERTREPAVLDDATIDNRFSGDPYIREQNVHSVLSLPILKHERLIGVLYLENKLSPGSFTSDRLDVLDLLMDQTASALENAQLYAALRSSEVRWRSLVEGLPDVVLLVSAAGDVEFVNHRQLGQLGQLDSDTQLESPPEIQIDALVHEADLEALRQQMRRSIDEACQTELELRASLLGSDTRWFSLRLAPIAIDGRVDRLVAVATDITDRREAERARAKFEAQARQQQRLESIGTLASGVAHEINNPVQGILNYAELISTMEDIPPMAREFAGEIGHESQRVATIVRSLLSFSRQETVDATSSTDIRTIIEGTLSLIRTVVKKDHIELELELPDHPIVFECRAQQIRQVIMNLLTNARDALVARWPGYHVDKRIDIRATTFMPKAETQAWLRVSVCDRGGGVPAAAVSRIFDPFFTTKGRDQGTGLGLAVSHGIIHEHGGELRLVNRPGEGACFLIELPLVQ